MNRERIAKFGDWTLWRVGGSNGWSNYNVRHRQENPSKRLPKVSFWVSHDGSRFARSYELGALAHGQREVYQQVRNYLRDRSQGRG